MIFFVLSRKLKICVFALMVLAVSATSAKAAASYLLAYPKAPYETNSSVFTLKADNTPVDVVHYYNKYSYAHLAYEGTVTFTVSLVSGAPITSFDISPHSYGLDVVATNSGANLTFSVPQVNSRYLVVKISTSSGAQEDLFIAADPQETNAPAIGGTVRDITAAPYNADSTGATLMNTTIQNAINDASTAGGGTVYFPPGVYKIGNNIALQSNVTLYLAAGAVLCGSSNRLDYTWDSAAAGTEPTQGPQNFVINGNVSNVAFKGRGMIDANSTCLVDGGPFGTYRKGIIESGQSGSSRPNGIIIQDITVKDATTWTLNIEDSENVTIKNVKMLNDYDWTHSDGYDMCSCDTVLVDNCLAVTGDDALDAKATSSNPLINVTYSTCVAFTHQGCGTKIGDQASGVTSNILFSNIDAVTCYRGMSISHDEGSALYTNVSFYKVRVEQIYNSGTGGEFVVAPICFWTYPGGDGPVSGVSVIGCYVENCNGFMGIIQGDNTNGIVSNIAFQGLMMDGLAITSNNYALKINIGANTTNITFAALSVPSPIVLQDGSTAITVYSNDVSSVSNLSYSFTATTGAKVMLVLLGDHNANSIFGGDPSTLSWNDQTLTRVATATSGTTVQNSSIYYLYNPVTDGLAHNITGLISNAPDVSWISAYTLNGVDTTVAPLPGTQTSGTNIQNVASINNTVTNIKAGAWAAVDSIMGGNVSDTVIVTPSGAVNISTDMAHTSARSATMGYISGLAAGSSTFTASYGGGGNTKISLTEAIFAPLPISAPANLIVTTGIPVQVLLTWNANTNAISYNVKRGTISGIYTVTNAVVSPTTNYVDTQVISGTTYYYVISAMNSLGESTNSSEVSVTPAGAPFPPADLTATVTGSDQLTLQWNGSFGATNYNVKSSTTTGTETKIGSTSGTSYIINGLVNGTTYYFIVSSAGAGGETNSAEVTYGFSPIILQDGSPLTMTATTSASINQPFTVTAGASVMVVCLDDYGARLSEPATLTRGTQTLTRDVQTAYNNGNQRSLAIYHLYNPVAGTANITGTLTGTSEIWVTAYTLNGVDTTVAPVTGSANSGTANPPASTYFTINFTGMAGGSWAALNSEFANASGLGIINGTSGMVTTVTNNVAQNTLVVAGYAAGLSAGAVTFTNTWITTPASEQKQNFAVEIFAPERPPGIPLITGIGVNGAALSLAVTNGTPGGSWALLQSTDLALPMSQWQTNATGTFDGGGNLSMNIANTATNKNEFYILKVQ